MPSHVRTCAHIDTHAHATAYIVDPGWGWLCHVRHRWIFRLRRIATSSHSVVPAVGISARHASALVHSRHAALSISLPRGRGQRDARRDESSLRSSSLPLLARPRDARTRRTSDHETAVLGVRRSTCYSLVATLCSLLRTMIRPLFWQCVDLLACTHPLSALLYVPLVVPFCVPLSPDH